MHPFRFELIFVAFFPHLLSNYEVLLMRCEVSHCPASPAWLITSILIPTNTREKIFTRFWHWLFSLNSVVLMKKPSQNSLRGEVKVETWLFLFYFILSVTSFKVIVISADLKRDNDLLLPNFRWTIIIELFRWKP